MFDYVFIIVNCVGVYLIIIMYVSGIQNLDVSQMVVFVVLSDIKYIFSIIYLFGSVGFFKC